MLSFQSTNSAKRMVLKNHFMPKPFHHLRFDMTKIKLKDNLLLPAGKNKIPLECPFLSMMRLLPVNMLVCVWLVFFVLTLLLSDCPHPLSFQILDSSFEMTLKVVLPLQSSCFFYLFSPATVPSLWTSIVPVQLVPLSPLPI